MTFRLPEAVPVRGLHLASVVELAGGGGGVDGAAAAGYRWGVTRA